MAFLVQNVLKWTLFSGPGWLIGKTEDSSDYTT